MKANGRKSKKTDDVRQGIKTGWPICLGYIPIGLAFGVLAQKAGLGGWEIGAMSLIVFAGSSQFVAVAMIGQGSDMLPIIAATFMINLRHLLMSSALAVYLRGSRKFLSLFAYGITDESFAVNLGKFRQGGWGGYQALAVNHSANFTWIGSTILGAYAGEFIPSGSFGIGYALTAMFICLLALQLRGKAYLHTALTAGALALLFFFLIPGNSYVIIASILSAAFGSFIRRASRRSAKK